MTKHVDPRTMQTPHSIESMFGSNPLSGLISDETYVLLLEHDLLSEKAIRDYQIRCEFRRMRKRGIPAYEAIEMLRDAHPYLQFDTIRKIVYRLGKK